MTRQVPSNTKVSFHIYRGPENETNPNFVSLDIILNRIFYAPSSGCIYVTMEQNFAQ